MMEAQTAKRVPDKSLFGAPYMYVLVVLDGAGAGAVHRITHAETVIGRGAEPHFGLEDDETSKRHCMIRVDGPVCTLLDLVSLNGTRLNDRPVRKDVAQRLRHLDEIRVGGTRLLFMTGRCRQQVVKA